MSSGPGTDPRDSLAPNLSKIENWESAYGGRNAYRVRVLEWFRDTVQRDIDKLKPFIEKMEDVRKTREMWNTTALDWSQTFSLTQVYAAKRKEPLKFAKAAKVLLLCEVAAEAKGIPASIFYSRMRIEPALFGLADFSPELLKEACAKKENLLALLRQGCGQATGKVFEDMAAGSAVSYRLAWNARELLRKHAPEVAWDDLIILPDREKRPRFSVVQRETIEGASVPVGAPDTFGA